MLDSIQIRNFKSFADADLALSPLTLLIGPNASGKSNAIEAIRVLSWLAYGRRLDDLLATVQEADQLIRGTVEKLPHEGSKTFGLGCTASSLKWNQFSIEIKVEADQLRIVDEEIVAPGSTVPLYAVVGPAHGYSHEIQVQYNNFARGGRKPQIPCTDQQAIFTQLETPARFGKGHKKAQSVIPEMVSTYRRFLENILFLDPSPRRMRNYSFKGEKRLRGDGSNLSSALYDLCEEQNQKKRVLDFIRTLPEQDITDVSFVETERNEVMVQLTESFGGGRQLWDAPNLSDGTLRVLAVAAALLSAQKNSMVVIEEIDNGVHPSRADTLLHNVLDIAEARSLRVLITTHNPALLDSLPSEAIPDVVCAYRDPERGDSKLVSLKELADYPELVARGPLGRSMTTGLIERLLLARRSEDEKHSQAMKWLDSFREELVEQ